MSVNERMRKTLQRVIVAGVGALGIILFRWTPTTPKGIAIYGAMFSILVLLAILLSQGKGGGYWPDKS